MRARNLFGVPVPEGAVRVVIRPVLGAGGSLPIYKGSFDDGVIPEDDDVVFAAAKNTQFWDYWDSRKGTRRGASPEATEWRLRLQFYDSKETEDAHTTERPIEFYRSRQAAPHEPSGKPMRVLKYLQRSTDKTVERMMTAVSEITKAATEAISKTAGHSADALKEVSKQTSVVSEMVKLHQEEAVELKETLLAFHAKQAKPEAAPGGLLQQAKDLFEMGKTLMSMGEGWDGAKPVQTPPGAK